MKKINIIFSAVLFLIAVSCSKNNSFLDLPAVISDNMVLQQNTNVAIWGQGTPGLKIKIKCEWGPINSIRVNENGKWISKIKTPNAGGPYTIEISTKDTIIKICNILIGEVWLCSGQSNMEMPLKGWPPRDTILNSKHEIENANYSNLRMFTVRRAVSAFPREKCSGFWEVCTPAVAGGFSATAYFFGKKLLNEINVPIGLIHSSWGGTPVESWTNGEYLSKHEDFENIIERIKNSEPEYIAYEQWLNSREIIKVSEPETQESYMGLDFNDIACAKPEFNDSNWDKMELPVLWEETKLGQFNGAVWFRKKIEIPEDWVGKELVLELGPVDDIDITYFNGEKVGANELLGFWTKKRVYEISADLVKSGENLIAVRVIDNVGGGGIWGEKEEMRLELKNGKNNEYIDISGEWLFLVAAEYYDHKLFVMNVHTNEYKTRPYFDIAVSQWSPTMLYNGMISPIKNYTIKGAIWYQGENNVKMAKQYSELFPLMIENWRSEWQLGDFPFYYVQIAPFVYEGEEQTASAELREAQRRTLKIKNTGMVVTLDIGDVYNIHPANKTDVGGRLANWALAKDYGKNVVYSGPIYKSMEIKNNKIYIDFEYAENGLKAGEKGLFGFEIAGHNGEFVEANAKINGNIVIVYNASIKNPKNVRYAYRNGSIASLFNTEGLPASTFTTEVELKE